ncbi:Anhydro-N-acetylmuramic acid kinase [Methylocella tundrae]|uniref:Anhydro-N-acetylmuramic acid kinase n=2 Tax=Methylocella tundrae TaxID=227605 RepID=A0A4U8Z4K3_METTU|nr:anhydro-N-acetylmuramic acid kinase [Methylocella tundrae]WPP04147.1 anhydro-N-acetylmuramic acid kinase [Methylocella tundrae]VFU10412.1 Anhydro-N-acetylmuramic acid kinase [Methylocella tundrae]
MTMVRTIGLMSGTSMDGVDVALIETDGEAEISFRGSGFLPYQDEDRALLRAAIADAAPLHDRRARPGALASAEAMVTQRHCEAVRRFLDAQGVDGKTIDVIGFHGQTVLHRPEKRLTVQIGDGAALARSLGHDVVYDFRAADVLRGGQGAPLVPVFHSALVRATGFAEPVAVINIGGVANVTFIEREREPIACDAGPGNALIDDLMLLRKGVAIDRDGATAARGRADEKILKDLLAHPFFALAPPKSLDRNAFSAAAVASLATEDAARTLTAFSAAAIARALDLMPQRPAIAVICGGGARNPTLMAELSARLPCRVADADAFGWSIDAMEAQAFAYMAVRRQKNLPITFPQTTGIDAPLAGGLIARPVR